MSEADGLSPWDEWPYHYRGFSLQVSPDGDVWWQLYQGTDRLLLQPAPDEIVEELLSLKRIGGRIHITEREDVLTRVEGESNTYEERYLGTVDSLDGDLTPADAPEYSLPLRPDGLDPGDLWPSVYDGSRYSFVDQKVWWHNSDTHKRHPVPEGLPDDILESLRRFKPEGGSFRILPWGAVITLVSLHPSPGNVSEQFGELPRVVKNIIKLRKSRDVEMLPIYVGSLDASSLTVEEPTSLTDELSPEEQLELANWAGNLGRTTETSAEAHRADHGDTSDSDGEGSDTPQGETPGNAQDSESGGPRFDDDPLEWMRNDMDSESVQSERDEGS